MQLFGYLLDIRTVPILDITEGNGSSMSVPLVGAAIIDIKIKKKVYFFVQNTKFENNICSEKKIIYLFEKKIQIGKKYMRVSKLFFWRKLQIF